MCKNKVLHHPYHPYELNQSVFIKNFGQYFKLFSVTIVGKIVYEDFGARCRVLSSGKKEEQKTLVMSQCQSQ